MTLGRHAAPWLLQPIELAAIGGIFSCLLAIHNTTVRVMFSMGRDRVLPASLGTVHPRWFSPYRAIIAQTCFTVVVGLGVASWLGPGATGTYGFTGAIGTVAIVIVYMLANIAHIRFFWRVPRRSTITHVIAPALGVISLAYPLYSVIAPGPIGPIQPRTDRDRRLAYRGCVATLLLPPRDVAGEDRRHRRLHHRRRPRVG